jgi:hypothetical protein
LTDIFQEVDEDLRRERAGALWLRYRWVILGLCTAIVVATGVWVAFRDWQKGQTLVLAVQYQVAQEQEAGGAGKGLASLEVLGAGGTDGYRLLARFQAAEIKAGGTDKAGGIAAYEAIAADTSIDPVYRDLATLLVALRQVDTAPKADLIARIESLTIAPNPWRFTALEVSALADLKAGDRDAALKLYQQLADDLDAPQAARGRAAEAIEALRHQG